MEQNLWQVLRQILLQFQTSMTGQKTNSNSRYRAWFAFPNSGSKLKQHQDVGLTDLCSDQAPPNPRAGGQSHVLHAGNSPESFMYRLAAKHPKIHHKLHIFHPKTDLLLEPPLSQVQVPSNKGFGGKTPPNPYVPHHILPLFWIFKLFFQGWVRSETR